MKSFFVSLLLLVGCQAGPAPKKAPQTRPSASSEVSSCPVELGPPALKEPVERLLAQYATHFSKGPKHAARVANIKRLVHLLGTVQLRPHEEFSFNETAGPRTSKRGFAEAPTYFLGEIRPGMGGGVCQVSSTIHAAALYANLDVLERHPHSRTSAYIDPGLDAAVNYPEVCWEGSKDPRVCYDLRLRNPYAFPIWIRLELGAETTKELTLSVSVLGKESGPLVSTKWITYRTPKFEQHTRQVSWLKEGTRRLKQAGRPGLEGVLRVTIRWPDRVETKSLFSRYQPVSEIQITGPQPEERPSHEAQTD